MPNKTWEITFEYALPADTNRITGTVKARSVAEALNNAKLSWVRQYHGPNYSIPFLQVKARERFSRVRPSDMGLTSRQLETEYLELYRKIQGRDFHQYDLDKLNFLDDLRKELSQNKLY